MIASGLKTTINTDDPGISRITLTDEYRIAMDEIGLSPEIISACVLNGARGSFQSLSERQELFSLLESRLITVFQNS
jgi:adenosine deaminase